ncbi:MAG: BamA/TamA family outer membrane protein [bacterium]|nr:BamA/TamA family outer membrane protein [bacterium]MDT8366944.1 BamA/TamA family outer membrane protein [bacterium]
MEQELGEYGELAPLREGIGVSLSPIVAYEPTFGMIYGGAVFLERELPPRYNFETILAFSTEGEYSVVLNLKKWVTEDTYFHLELDVDDFTRPYYGEGMDSDPSKRIDLEGTVHQARYFLKFVDKNKISFGPFLEYRGTIPGDVIGNDLAPPEYREATLDLGMCLFYDSRDSELSPASGTFHNLTIRYVFDYLSTFQGSDTFFQADVDSRVYYSPAPGTVLAGRVHLAGSWGEPSYQYRYWLGGPYELRGFSANRFRGDSMYVVQGEVRQSLFGIFSGAAFAEVGEATDHSFQSPETSYGGGLRMTLPPDHIGKVRLDFAWAKDEHSIYFVFGGAF